MGTRIQVFSMNRWSRDAPTSTVGDWATPRSVGVSAAPRTQRRGSGCSSSELAATDTRHVVDPRSLNCVLCAWCLAPVLAGGNPSLVGRAGLLPLLRRALLIGSRP